MDDSQEIVMCETDTVCGICLAILGVPVSAGGVLLVRSTWIKLRTWKRVSGTVTGYRANFSNGNPTPRTKGFYFPEVQFDAGDGNIITFTSSTGSNVRPPRVGTTVEVLRDPTDPKKAAINSFSNLWVAPMAAIFFGVGFLGMGLALIFLGRK